MPPGPMILAAFGPWRRSSCTDFLGLQRDLVDRIGDGGACRSVRRHGDIVLAAHLDATDLLTVIEVACRDTTWACGISLRPPPNPEFASIRVVDHARRTPWGIAVRRDHADARTHAVAAVLALHASIVRGRRSATWRSIDAVRQYRTSTAASRQLGVSPQAVAKQLRRGHVRATAQTATVLAHLLATSGRDAPTAPSGEARRDLAVPD